MKLAVFLVMLAFSTSHAQAALPSDVRRAASRISSAVLMRDVEYFASDSLGGRATFSSGLDRAASYLVRRLRAAGLTPLGDSGGFRQYYDVKEAIADTSRISLEAHGRRFGFGDVLLFRIGDSVRAIASVVYVGTGWRIPSRNIDPYAGLDVRDKVVMITGTSPAGLAWENLPGDAEAPGAIASRMGALAIVLVGAPPGGYERFLGNISTTDVDGAVPSFFARMMTQLILRPAVTRAIFGADSVRARQILAGAELPSFELPDPIHLDVPVRTTKRRAYNIVAKIVGNDRRLRSEYVTLGAHLDGIQGPPLGADSIYNAADDDASGSAAILAIAEQLARARPRRSVAFIWSTGHEIGLWGTRSFVGKRIIPTDRIVTHINVDMVGVSRRPGTADSASMDATLPHEVYVTGPRAISIDLDSLVETTNRAHGHMRLNHRYDTPESEMLFPRTDGAPFVERGVPLIDFFTGFHRRYHRPNDEAPYLDPQKLEEVARTVFFITWALADTPARPRLSPGYPARVPHYRVASGALGPPHLRRR